MILACVGLEAPSSSMIDSTLKAQSCKAELSFSAGVEEVQLRIFEVSGGGERDYLTTNWTSSFGEFYEYWACYEEKAPNRSRYDPIVLTKESRTNSIVLELREKKKKKKKERQQLANYCKSEVIV